MSSENVQIGDDVMGEADYVEFDKENPHPSRATGGDGFRVGLPSATPEAEPLSEEKLLARWASMTDGEKKAARELQPYQRLGLTLRQLDLYSQSFQLGEDDLPGLARMGNAVLEQLSGAAALKAFLKQERASEKAQKSAQAVEATPAPEKPRVSAASIAAAWRAKTLGQKRAADEEIVERATKVSLGASNADASKRLDPAKPTRHSMNYKTISPDFFNKAVMQVHGSPWMYRLGGNPALDYRVRIHVDCGRVGIFGVKITIWVAKEPVLQAVDLGPDRQRAHLYYQLDVPISIDDMDDMQCVPLADDVRFPCPAIVGPNARKGLVQLSFKTNAHFMERTTTQWARKAQPWSWFQADHLRLFASSVQKLLSEEGTVKMLFTPSQADWLQKGWPALLQAKRWNLQQCPQYLNRADEVDWQIDTAQTYDQVGQGMFRKDDESVYYYDPQLAYTGVDELARPLKIGTLRQYQSVREDLRPFQENLQCGKLVPLSSYEVGEEIVQTDFSSESPALTDLLGAFYKLYVQLPRNKQHRRLVPTPSVDEEMTVDFGLQERRTKVYVRNSDKRRHWRGTVISADEQELRKQDADFCLLVRKPADFNVKPEGTRVWLKFFFNTNMENQPMEREVTGVTKLFDPKEHPELEDLRKNLAASDLDAVGTMHSYNLYTSRGASGGNAALAKKLIDDAKQSEWLNDDQLSVLEQFKRLTNFVFLVYGPPGTGKSKLLAAAAVVLAACGHKVLMVGVSNLNVDSNTVKVREEAKRTADRNPDGDYFLPTICRLQANREEKRSDAQLRKLAGKTNAEWLDWDDFELLRDKGAVIEQDKNEQPPLDSFMESCEQTMIAEIVRVCKTEDFDPEDSRVKEIFEHYEMLKKNYLYTHQHGVQQKTLPVETTLAWHVEKFVADFKKAKSSMTRHDFLKMGDGTTLEGIEWMKEYEELRLLQRTSSLERGQIKRYRHLHKMVSMAAIARVDILITMNNNAGSELASAFPATYLLADEGGQATAASALIPLTNFKKLVGATIAGDHRQMDGSSMLGKPNEYRDMYGKSLSYLLAARRCPGVMLRTQYRMHRDIQRWPSLFYYGGLLQSGLPAGPDSAATAIVRKVSKEHYGINGPKGQGACYFGIDMRFSHHCQLPGGHSLRNAAHAKRVATLLKQLYAEGILPSQVCYLTYYKGQEGAVKAACEFHGVPQPANIGTIDGHQGEEGSIIILDTVVGSCLKGKEAGIGGKISPFVKQAERLNVGITRARDGCIVLVNGDYIRNAGPKTALAAMIVDMQEKKILYDNVQDFDDDELNAPIRATYPAKFRNLESRPTPTQRLEVLKPWVCPFEYGGLLNANEANAEGDS